MNTISGIYTRIIISAIGDQRLVNVVALEIALNAISVAIIAYEPTTSNICAIERVLNMHPDSIGAGIARTMLAEAGLPIEASRQGRVHSSRIAAEVGPKGTVSGTAAWALPEWPDHESVEAARECGATSYDQLVAGY